MLQDAISNVDDYEFEIEQFLINQVGAIPLPFPGMDKNKAPLCEFFLKGTCTRGFNCPFRHIKGERVIVCKHWLRQLCNKGDDCEFLHEYDMGRMPVCYFFQKFGECNNKDCQFMHVDAESLKIKDCPWYDRGFCKHGPSCRNRHTRRVMCQKYLFGFCPDGISCKHVHPRYELPGTKTFPIYHTSAIFGNLGSLQPNQPPVGTSPPPPATSTVSTTNQMSQDVMGMTTPNNVTVLNANNNLYLKTTQQAPPQQQTITGQQQTTTQQPQKQFIRRPLHEVTCFKCGEKGHYANMCPKSFRAMQLGLVGSQPNVGVK